MCVRWGKYTSSVSSLAGAVKSGFDWFQLPLELIMEMSDEQFSLFRAKAMKNHTRFDICALNLPEDVVITQKGFNIYVWMEYIKKSLIRMSALDCKSVAWRGGLSRLLPEEGDIIGAKEQVAQFIYLLCDLSGQYGIKILIEPLNDSHTNFLNTIEETAAFLKLISMENIGISISERELPMESFSPEILTSYKDIIQLVRIENRFMFDSSAKIHVDPNGESIRSVLDSLRISNYSAAILLSEDSGDEELTFCKNILK